MSLRLAVCFCVLFFGFHFSPLAQVRIFAGPQLTTASYSIRDAKQSTDRKTGFTAGVGLTKPIEGPIFFSPAVYFSRKGYKVTFDRPGTPPDSAAKNNNTTISTIAFAPLLQLNFSKKQNHFFLRFGPAVEIAVSGKEIFDKSGNRTVSRSMLFDPTAYSRTAASVNAQLGFEHRSGLGIFAHYEHGLSSLNNNDRGPVILNRAAGVSVQWTSPRPSPAKQ